MIWELSLEIDISNFMKYNIRKNMRKLKNGKINMKEKNQKIKKMRRNK